MLKKNILFFSLFLFFVYGLTISCNTTEPPNPPPPVVKPILTLELEDAHCTEAWLQLTTKDLTLPAELILKQFNPTGDSVSQTFSLSTKDTLLYIDSLLPNQTYSFQLSSIQSATGGQVSSIKQLVTTMDTTSHNFTFETITFGGQIGSSVLFDVAIINENNIWAVGEVWIADTSQLGYTKYNAVHWDGNSWELKKIMFYTICGQPYTGAYPAKSVWIVGENELWIALDGNQIAKIVNGVQVATICLPSNVDMSINKIWGSGSNDIYIVGNSGNIAHYNGTSWSKIASGTTLNINDIWGDYNEKTQELEILAVASNYGTSPEKELLLIKNKIPIKQTLSENVWPLRTVWFEPQIQYYIAGAGIYQKKLLSDSIWKNQALDITEYGTTSISGNSINDIIAVGAFGDFLHFNGVNWKQYQEPYLYNGAYTKVSIKKNLVFALGGNQISALSSEAVILIGRR